MKKRGEMISSRVAFGQVLVELGHENPKLVVVDADTGNSTKSATFAAEFPDRFVQMGIAEQNMIGVAAGLALTGWTPITSTFACFISKRALDQVRVSVVQPGLNVKMTGGYSGLMTGKAGISHQSVQDIAIFRAMPQITLLAPGDAVETRAAMRAAVAHPGPVYIRLTRDPLPVVMEDDYVFEIGRAVTMREGRDVTLMTTGWLVIPALEAVDQLAEEGISTSLLHLPTIKPFDAEAVERAARTTGAIVTAEDHSIIGGLGSAVAETLAECCPTAISRVGICDCYAESGSNDELLEKYGLTAGNIAAHARSLLKRLREDSN